MKKVLAGVILICLVLCSLALILNLTLRVSAASTSISVTSSVIVQGSGTSQTTADLNAPSSGIVYAFATTESSSSSAVPSISDTKSLIWTQRFKQQMTIGSTYYTLIAWYADPLSKSWTSGPDKITVTVAGTAVIVGAMSISNVNPKSPFDGQVSSPVYGTGTSSTENLVIQTADPNDEIIGVIMGSTNTDPTGIAGFTVQKAHVTSSPYLNGAEEYKVSSSAMPSGQNVGYNYNAGTWMMFADAVTQSDNVVKYTLNIRTIGVSSDYTSPTFTAGAVSQVLGQTPTDYYVTVGANWTITNPLTNSGPTNERWQSNDPYLRGVVGSSSWIHTFQFYQQYRVTFQYTPADQELPYSPTAYYTQFSASASKAAAKAPTSSDWVDTSTAIAYTNPITNGLNSERWQASFPVVNGDSTIVTSVSSQTSTVDPTYYTQYYLEVDNGGQGATQGSGWYNSGSNQTFSITPTVIPVNSTVRYAFNGWMGDSTSQNPTTSIVMNCPKTIAATWVIQYFLEADNGGQGATQGSGWYNSGSNQTFSITPIMVPINSTAQYVFAGWSGNSTSMNANSSVIMDSPKRVIATWAIQYYITVDNGGHGSPSQGSQWVTKGKSFTTSVANITDIYPQDHQWVVLKPTLSISDVETAQTLNFSWTEQFWVGFLASPSDGGLTTPNSTGLWENIGSLPISAIANDSYQFNGWFSNTPSISFVDSSGASTTAMINGAGTITASFTLNLPYRLEVSVPSTATAGKPFNLTITAFDSHGSVAVGYSGIIHFSSTSIGILPNDSVLSRGTGTFAVTLTTAGFQTITSTDANNFLNATSGFVLITPGDIDHISISPPMANITTGNSQTYSATAYDAYNNSLGEVTSNVIFSAPGASVSGNVVSSNIAGTYAITAIYSGETATASLVVNGEGTSGSTTGGGQTNTSPSGNNGNTIPSSGNNANVYSLIFTENGLPTNQAWNIMLNGITLSSSADQIIFSNLSSGNFSWTAQNAISGGTGIQFVSSSTKGIVNLPATSQVNITFTTQYYLAVSSDYGKAIGEGWYDAGSMANFSANSPVTDNSGNQYDFAGWSGSGDYSYSGPLATQSVMMNMPVTEKANWTPVYTANFYKVAVPIIAIFAIAVLMPILFGWREVKRRKATGIMKT